MEINYGLLREAIKRRYKTQGNFAKSLGVTPQTMTRLLSNKSNWSTETIFKAASLLGIPSTEFVQYFFTPIVQEAEPMEEA